MTPEGRFRGPGGRLRGRAKECALLDDLVSAIRRGESRSLVLRGEAGIGKTALLEYLIASAPDATVVRAVGVQSDMELAFASLHQLCGPLPTVFRDPNEDDRVWMLYDWDEEGLQSFLADPEAPAIIQEAGYKRRLQPAELAGQYDS